ncbi:hypothetical protein D0Y97_23845 [Escherichia coli]|nr:hypothetical protein [Escherichia coli]EFO2707801.1 hypothetical protein [Escherichia coli]
MNKTKAPQGQADSSLIWGRFSPSPFRVRVNICTGAACSPHPNPLPEGARGPIELFWNYSQTQN